MNILVPTDFSKFANYALDAACQIAPFFESSIHLLHASSDEIDQQKQTDPAGHDHASTKENSSDAQARLENLKSVHENCGADIQLHLRPGSFMHVVELAINNLTIQLMVMGSHGSSGIEDFFIGSNTQKVLRKLHLPVLVIKNKLTTLDFSRVLFASGLHIKDHEAFKYFLDFIKPFKVKELHILAVDTSSAFSQPAFAMESAMADFKKEVRGIDCQTHFYSDFSIESGIRHFSEAYNINLIAMSNHGRSVIRRIFQGSHLEMVINRTSLPVLSIDY